MAGKDLTEALAKRIKRAKGISLMEQPNDPGPLWAMPLSDADQKLIVASLLSSGKVD